MGHELPSDWVDRMSAWPHIAAVGADMMIGRDVPLSDIGKHLRDRQQRITHRG